MNKAAFYINISGYTQTRGTFHGILKLREELMASGYSDGIKQRVWYLPWTSNFQQIATDLVTVCAHHGVSPIVLISGYSYGGWGAIQLANQLDGKGVGVQVMVLSDPVSRPNWLPRFIPAASSLLGRRFSRKLVVPPNVKNLFSFYQVQNRPQGHKLVVSNGTKVDVPIKLQKKHNRMDDTQEFHDRVIREAEFIRRQFIEK